MQKNNKRRWCIVYHPHRMASSTHKSVYFSIYLAKLSIWLKSWKLFQDAPTPAKFGGKLNRETWQSIWMSIPEPSKNCRELIKCNWKAELLCFKDCCSKKIALACTSLCHCKGHCEQWSCLWTINSYQLLYKQEFCSHYFLCISIFQNFILRSNRLSLMKLLLFKC